MQSLSPVPASAASRRIAVQSLALTDFRNYPQLRLETGGASVVLTGENGAGKTNILEAVSFLAPGRGLRRARLSEIDRQGAGAWVVAAGVQSPLGEVKIGTGRDEAEAESDKRLVRIDGKPARGTAELAAYVSLVWQTPQMDQLFQEGASARRKFLDRLVFGFEPEHAARVNAYEYAMRERNRLLSAGRADPLWLDSLERKMAESSVAIAAARLQTVAHLNAVMQASTLSFPKAHLELCGHAEDLLKQEIPAVQAEESLAQRLHSVRADDARSGRSSAGAHKSELAVTHCLKNMEAALCSTGEQKALLLSMVLAEARAGALWHDRIPVILLDEVVAHLDENKRIELYEEISDIGAQAWLTGTDAFLLQGMRDTALFFRVEMGKVIPS